MTTTLVPSGYPRLYEIRDRIVAVLATALTGWTQSAFAPASIGLDGGPVASLIYSVEFGDTEIQRAAKHRHGSTDYAREPWQAITSVTVRWIWKLRADAPVADYSAALSTEEKILGALVAGGMVVTNTHEIEITGLRREVIADGGFLLGTINASIGHVYVIEVAS